MAKQRVTPIPEENPKITPLRMAVLQNQVINDKTYEVDDSFRPANTSNPLELHTTHELVEYLKKNKESEIDARVISVGAGGKAQHSRLDKKSFLESWDKNNNNKKLKESFDAFAMGRDDFGGSPRIGDDFIPLLGGPFFKQLYIYDYLRMHALSFNSYHHDPFARAVVNIMTDFTLGGGWRLDCEDKTHQAIWDAFVEANDLYTFMDNAARELSIYGETMLWFLPNMESRITYQLRGLQQVPHGALPRVRLIDPSCIWEVITYPEDITRVIAYQWVAPTQFQIYSAQSQGSQVGSSKFIFQQIPGDQVMHVKINCVSNEKRGRSDLFPILSYLKRLRDSVQYSVLGLQKNMAWSIDTTIKGNQQDIDNYIANQQELGPVPPAASEFVHTEAIKREYMANQGRAAGASEAFDWCVNMIAAGTGIPATYFGLTGGSHTTRASALVGTEPVTKRFEKRRKIYENMIRRIAKFVFSETYGIDNVKYEVTFPELVSQDRSAKLKDLSLCVAEQWISRERAASMAAKELDVTDFNFKIEEQQIQDELNTLPPLQPMPLSTPPTFSPGGSSSPAQSPEPKGQPSAVTAADRRKIDLENN